MQHNQTPPTPAELQSMNVNVPAGFSGITFPLYDSAVYPAAGTGQLMFFQTPAGSGGKTLADTNMQAAGQVQSPNVFVVTGVEVKFISGVPIEVLEAAAVGNYISDVDAFYQGTAAGNVREGGYLEFASGSAYYLREPIHAFPPSNRLNVQAASSNSTTAAAAQFYLADYAENSGLPFEVSPLALPSNQTFQVTLNWPGGVVALPSTKPGKVFVKLNGWMYRPVQA